MVQHIPHSFPHHLTNMKLDLNRILKLYPLLKILHYQTKEGFHHEKYDEAFDDLGELADKFIETYMGLNGRDWIAGSLPMPKLVEPNTRNCVARYRMDIIDDLIPYLYQMARGHKALNKLAEDFDEAAHGILGLLENFSNGQ